MVVGHGLEQVNGLVADGFEGAANKIVDPRVASESKQGPPRLGVPVGCAQTGEGGHHVDPSV